MIKYEYLNMYSIMKIQEITRRADLFGFLSDPTRLRIVDILTYIKGEICVSEIAEAVEASQSATSHQLRKLEMMGIVTKCRYGQEVCYSLNNESEQVKEIIKLLND